VSQNVGGVDGQEFTFSDDSLTLGDFIYVTYTNGEDEFKQYFGFDADYTSTALNFNGDQDSFELYFDGTLVDQFGAATITNDDYNDWIFQDGWTYRINGTEPSATFNVYDWMVNGGVLDG
jgi:hypothetical protein